MLRITKKIVGKLILVGKLIVGKLTLGRYLKSMLIYVFNDLQPCLLFKVFSDNLIQMVFFLLEKSHISNKDPWEAPE